MCARALYTIISKKIFLSSIRKFYATFLLYMCYFFVFATFFEKKVAPKNFHTGKFLSHTVRSTVKSAMFALHPTDNFLLRFFLKKRTGFGATPHYLRVFFLLGFFATFLKKGSTKNFSKGKVFAHIAGSTVESKASFDNL